MPKTISLINQRSAYGKIFVATQLALAVSNLKLRTILIDINPFGDVFKNNLSAEISFNSYQIFTAPEKFRPQPINVNLDLIPSSIDLIQSEVDFIDLPNWEFNLQQFIQNYLSAYDVVIIDNPPSLGKLVVNSLVASNLIILPVTDEEIKHSVNESLIYALNQAFINLNTNNLEVCFLLNEIKSLVEAANLRIHLKKYYPYHTLHNYITLHDNSTKSALQEEFICLAKEVTQQNEIKKSMSYASAKMEEMVARLGPITHKEMMRIFASNGSPDEKIKQVHEYFDRCDNSGLEGEQNKKT